MYSALTKELSKMKIPVSRREVPEIDKLAEYKITSIGLPSSLLAYCKISTFNSNKNKKYLKVKFPIDSAYGNLNDYQKFYFKDSSNPLKECTIKDAVLSNEILFHGDISYESKNTQYRNLSSRESSGVKLKKKIRSNNSLIVLVKNGSYIDRYRSIILNRRGSQVLYGIVFEIDPYTSNFYKVDTPEKIKSNVNPRLSILYKNFYSHYNCEYQDACYKYLKLQSFDFGYFDRSGNRCYCKDCFPENWINSQHIANETYIIPRGWCRFGLKVPKIFAEANQIWDNWCNVFHGTSPDAAKSIIEHKGLLLHGDITRNGQRIGKKCSAEEWGYYYTSPHICYSSHPWYSNIIKLPSTFGSKKYAQIAIAIKIRYGSYEKERETEGGAKKIFDDYSIIPENEIEWYSKKRGCIAPYGVLVRIFGEAEKAEIERLA